ncbi:putative amino acid permease YhdG [Posidoniimonas polymericola]|uniref:Putative amino acid permease YhdG n=2 Tax=Posidoniimonas polymericola TaxID=2528002 RepID=A0A5C5YSK2_9BACT|nr:putative amino acid permease YhdG [Posidoniimonas polymericola]
MATAVISAGEAMHYAHDLWAPLNVTIATICLLAAFMLLTILGISESSRVAIAIFLTHLASLTTLLVVGVVYLLNNGFGLLTENLSTPTETGPAEAIFFGFSAALLGISGFESSANFVEEQAEGVFPKTLRNMWLAVSFFNPMMALLALAVVPIVVVGEHEETLLSYVGAQTGGNWLAWLISIDAVLVLSGAVLTSFVGVNGLVHRMTLDRCLPQFLLKTNRRGSTHRIIITFFLLCVSVLLITRGELKALAGVYTISFLAVMALFGFGNILLKVKREGLPRPTRAPWPSVLVAIAAVVAGIIGNAVLNPPYLEVFAEYFFPTLLFVVVMLERINILRFCLFVLQATVRGTIRPLKAMTRAIRAKIKQINAQQIVFFTRGDNIANLNSASCTSARTSTPAA